MSDIHFPYHSKQAWDLALQLVKHAQPERIHLGGDIIDCEAVSRFVKHPSRLLGFQQEIDVAKVELQRLFEACPKADFEYREGNHEARLKKMLWNQQHALASLEALTIPELLWLDVWQMQWLPEERKHRIGKLWFLHGHEQPASFLYPARGLYMKLGGNIIVGHFHKFDKHVHKQFNGSRHGVWVNGCLSTLEPEYLVNAQWENGLTFIDFAKSGHFQVLPVPFVATAKRGKRLSASWDGRVFVSS